MKVQGSGAARERADAVMGGAGCEGLCLCRLMGCVSLLPLA